MFGGHLSYIVAVAVVSGASVNRIFDVKIFVNNRICSVVILMGLGA